jgi:hypothetical protein
MVPSRAKAPEQSGALLLWMRVRIVRKVAAVSALSDAAVKASQGRWVPTFPIRISDQVNSMDGVAS